MIRLTTIVVAAATVLSACGTPNGQPTPQFTDFSVAPQNAPSGAAVDTFALNHLDGLQARSFVNQREYCGYFFIDNAGQLQATRPIAGTFAGCALPAPQVGQGIFASYHTHGSYDPDYDNEVPSDIDLVSDFNFGIDGYVSTPGGRVWLVDFQTLTTRQLCGLRCVTTDPRFRPQGEEGIRSIYTLDTLQQRAAQF